MPQPQSIQVSADDFRSLCDSLIRLAQFAEIDVGIPTGPGGERTITVGQLVAGLNNISILLTTDADTTPGNGDSNEQDVLDDHGINGAVPATWLEMKLAALPPKEQQLARNILRDSKRGYTDAERDEARRIRGLK
jgi:hypothetical protein